MRTRIFTHGWELLDIFFPPRCAGCDKWGERYCTSCQEKTNKINSSMCQVCGEPGIYSLLSTCQRCQNFPPQYSALRSWAYFEGPIQKAIHQLKYKRNLGLANTLAQPLIELFRSIKWEIDLVSAIPLDGVRKRERGYNQSLLIARPLAWETGLPLKASAVKRIRNTRSQVGLTLNERKTNVQDAFQADSGHVWRKSVLLIDDVATTGATLNSCAAALRDAGAINVYGLTLARSLHY